MEGQIITFVAAYPVVTQVGGGSKWEAFDWKLLEKVKTSVMQNGLRSPVTQQMLKYIFTADQLLPMDVLQIAEIVLTLSQQLLFHRVWSRLCDQETARPRDQNDPLYGIQSQMLTGQGPFADAQMQLGFIPQVIQLSQQLALQAILSVQESGQPTAFAHIKQGQNEQFMQFVDQLYKAIETHPDLTGDMKTKMFQLLAFDNANERRKQNKLLVAAICTSSGHG